MTERDDYEAAMARLPTPYSTALRLREAGLPDEFIAEAVGVELEALGPLLRVGAEKLAAALRRPDDSSLD
jgi:DNA-directed RNA polymerase specialized sigma24 family protein